MRASSLHHARAFTLKGMRSPFSPILTPQFPVCQPYMRIWPAFAGTSRAFYADERLRRRADSARVFNFVSAKFPLPIPSGGRIIDTEAAAPGMCPADGANLMRGGHSGRAFMWDMSSARSMCAGCIGLRGGRVRAPRACAADRAPCHHPMRERGHTDRPCI